MFRTTLALCLCLSAATGAYAASPPTMADQKAIDSAMSAAPPALAKDAAIMTFAADGSMRHLRDGTNGYTCMPDIPTTPGVDPMCADANAMEWAMAMFGRKPPPEGKPGFIYMLMGGSDPSNLDPYATKPMDGHDWVKTGPHVMVVGAPGMLVGYPGGARPDTSKPYVMFPDTPYAHLMLPVH
ncbi:hypothetical protein [Caulobacter radicis]|uniref:Uncharacterized protein n=1 Tax=Caulobacter radicis TaxID=2172650 RepID=A0A2T9JVY8_9CAUL|nr:hypothetical protein [Caulobacter radicis]PVM87875.1 hypothetical protein DDF65_02795 [Caulobacter radicis]